MYFLIFFVSCTSTVAALVIHQNYLEAKQLHHDRVNMLSNRHISIDQVLEEIMEKDI